MSNSTAPPLLDPSASLLQSLARLFLATLLATLTLVALLLIARRFAGALLVPLDFLPALAAGLLIAAGTWTLRRVAAASEPDLQRWLLLITIITWVLVIAITLARMNPLAVFALWLPVITAEAAWRVLPHNPLPLSSAPLHLRPSLPADQNVVQQFTRTRREDGELIRGVAQLRFATGEQTAALHLAFSPPLAADPQVEVKVIDAGTITLRMTESRTYGVRIEGRRRREETAQPLTLLVQIEASTVSARIEVVRSSITPAARSPQPRGSGRA